MTLFLSEEDVEGLLEMGEVVDSVEEAFRREARGEVTNSSRTRSSTSGAALNVMHSVLPYLGRGGLKAYMSTPSGNKFVVLLFDMADSAPLAVMGADILGRYRTGAASGVATRHLYGKPSAVMAVFGSGKQALTQVMAVSKVTSLDEVRIWSPTSDHRESFAGAIRALGLKAVAMADGSDAARGADIASAITSAKYPFITREMVENLDHLNLCGGNNPDHSEIFADALGAFGTIAVDDIAQGRVEYGDLIQAASKGMFGWERAVELCKFVSGDKKPTGRTMFKSGGASLEDIAVASHLYDKALESGKFSSSYELT